MASSGNGETDPVKAEGVHTVANSANSQRSGKRNTAATAKQEQQLGAAEALEVLNSAVNYCNKAGLPVTYLNRAGKLILFIEGAHCDPTAKGAKFLPLPVLASEGEG